MDQLILRGIDGDDYADEAEPDEEPPQQIPRPPLALEDGGPRSFGEAMRDPARVTPEEKAQRNTLALRLSRVGVGGHVAYRTELGKAHRFQSSDDLWESL